jgi:hypothetical protein
MRIHKALILVIVTIAATSYAGDRTLLLVDDNDVLYRAGVKRTLTPLQRQNEPALAPTEPWEKLLGYVSAHRVGDEIYLHYQCYSAAAPNGIGVCLGISKDDGASFTKPGFGVWNTTAGKPSNIVFYPGPKFYFGSVLYEPDSVNPQRVWKMIFWDEQVPAAHPTWKVPGLYTAVSSDGIHWTQLGAVGEVKVLGAYGNPDVQPPKVSERADDMPEGAVYSTRSAKC